MSIKVQPPTQAAVGQVLYPPLVVGVTDAECDSVQVVAMDLNDTVYWLGGTWSTSPIELNDSAPGSSQAMSYAVFPDLFFNSAGTFKIAVSTSKWDNDSHVVLASTETREITVSEHEVALQTPSKSEATLLRRLRGNVEMAWTSVIRYDPLDADGGFWALDH
ncbi:hypothetical protein BJ170DRAFT_682092 [Xylariales sp. AK1849]|nr:hypothetical protein BJ170DRAFT_682092 [Xylariales sp. AK1849]